MIKQSGAIHPTLGGDALPEVPGDRHVRGGHRDQHRADGGAAQVDPQADRACFQRFKLSVWSGIEDVASNPVQPMPIRSVHFENPTDRLADGPTGSQSLSK